MEPNIDQNATCEFLIFIDFIVVFPLLLRLGGSYVGSISVLFAHRFWHRFLVDLGLDFGALLGAFGGSKSIIFGIDLGMIFACRSKSGLRAPKSGPGAPKSAPRAPKRRTLPLFLLHLPGLVMKELEPSLFSLEVFKKTDVDE